MASKRRGDLLATMPDRLSEQRPKGEQLQEILEDFVATLEPGTPLPGELLLRDRFGVARGTVTQAIDELVAKGLIYRVERSGTYVAERKLRQPGTLTSFSEDMRAQGMTPGSIVLDQEIVPASLIIARQLEVESGTSVVHLQRVRLADGEPMALERSYLPAPRFPGLEAEDLTDASLYDTLGRRWGVQVASAEQWFNAIRPTEAEAAHLGVTPDQPALLFQRVTHDPAGRVIEFARSLYRGDRYEVHVQLRRPEPEGAPEAGFEPGAL